MDLRRIYRLSLNVLTIICLLSLNPVLAQSDPPPMDSTKSSHPNKQEGKPLAPKVEPVGRPEISQDPADPKKFLAKIQIKLENPNEDTRFLYLKFDRLGSNLVEILPWKVITGAGLNVLDEPTSGSIQKDPFRQFIPLVTIADKDINPKRGFVFLLEVTFKPTLHQRNFPCVAESKGAFKLEIFGTSKALSEKAGPKEIELTTSPICVGPLPEPSYTKEEAISLGALYLEQALAKKTIADELFLQGRKGAAEKYDEALRSLKKARTLQDDKKTTLSLLETDIEYRTTLLALGLDFWGGLRTNTPGIPMRHLIALEDLANEFERVMTQIDSAYDKADSQEQNLTKAKAALEEVTGKLNGYLVDKDRGRIAERHERRMVDISWSELRDIQSQQVKLSNRMATLDTLQTNLQSQANKMLANAVAKSAGLDPNLIQGVRDGNMDKVISQYVTSQLGDPNSPLMAKVGSFSKESQKFVDYYNHAKKSKQDLDRLKGEVEFAAEAMRTPSLENLRELGKMLLQSIPEDKKRALEARVKAQLPATEWMRSAEAALKDLKKDDMPLRELIAKEIGGKKLAIDDLRRVIFSARDRLLISEEGIHKSALEIRGLAKRVLKGLNKVGSTANDAKAFLSVTSRSFPEYVVQKWPPEVVNLMRAHFKVSSNEQLIAKLESGALKELDVVVQGIDEVRIKSELTGQELQLRTNVLLDNLENTQLSNEKAGKDLTVLFENLLLESRSHADIIFSSFPLDVLTSTISKFKGTLDDQKIAKVIQAHLESEMILDKVTVIGVERMMGATYSGQVFDSMPVGKKELTNGTPSSIAVDEPGPESGTSGQVDPATSQLLATALDMAFPGAGTAFSLAQTFASMDANRELMDHLTAEGAQLMARQNELVDRQSERYVAALLSELDQRRAQALADSADAQIGTFQYAMRKAVEEKNIQMLKIGIRRGWAFYLAERMREEFDQFDRSYALWARGKSEKGVIEQEIRNDPQNVRYALDSQIQLFDWLDRSRESAKTDPDFLRVHWNRMLRLAKDVCGKQGCKPGDGLLGQIGNTREVHVVSELLSSHDRQRFLDWQRKPVGAFRVAFQISPMNGLVPPTAYNIRLVDLRLAGLDHKGSSFTTEQVSLSHTGVSYIGIPAQTSDETLEYRLESLLPRESSSFNSPTEFDLDALRRRYDSYFTGSNLPSARNFEGYGLFATYEIVIEPTQANLKLKDIVLRLAYFYQHLGSVPNEAAFMRQQLAKQGKKLQTLSSRFPELAPYDVVLASNNKRCSLPVPESADRQLFGSDIQLRIHSYEATSFFAGRRERKWPVAINHTKIKDLKDRITLLGECSKGELKPMLKSIAAVKERALSLGRSLDQDQEVAAQYISALGLPRNARLEQEFPKLAEQEFLAAKDAQ